MKAIENTQDKKPTIDRLQAAFSHFISATEHSPESLKELNASMEGVYPVNLPDGVMPILQKALQASQVETLTLVPDIQNFDSAAHPAVACLMGRLYASGLGVEKNDKEAVKWFTKAAAQGDAPAQCNLGVMYHNGQGVAQNDEKAVEWYAQAAAQGDALAQYNLGVMYRKGQGVAQNDEKAVEWYAQAAAQGHAPAQANLGLMYDKGRGVEKNDAEAVEWYAQAAAQGHAPAQYNLGVMYKNGRGVAQNDVEAVTWFTKAAAQGHALAQFNLGVMYYDGQGVEQNYEKAVELWSKAAAQGTAAAQNNLGLIYSRAPNDRELGSCAAICQQFIHMLGNAKDGEKISKEALEKNLKQCFTTYIKAQPVEELRAALVTLPNITAKTIHPVLQSALQSHPSMEKPVGLFSRITAKIGWKGSDTSMDALAEAREAQAFPQRQDLFNTMRFVSRWAGSPTASLDLLPLDVVKLVARTLPDGEVSPEKINKAFTEIVTGRNDRTVKPADMKYKQPTSQRYIEDAVKNGRSSQEAVKELDAQWTQKINDTCEGMKRWK